MTESEPSPLTLTWRDVDGYVRTALHKVRDTLQTLIFVCAWGGLVLLAIVGLNQFGSDIQGRGIWVTALGGWVPARYVAIHATRGILTRAADEWLRGFRRQHYPLIPESEFEVQHPEAYW